MVRRLAISFYCVLCIFLGAARQPRFFFSHQFVRCDEDKQEAESELPASAGSVTIHHSSFQSDASSVSSLCVCRACCVLVLLMITPMKTIEAALARR